MQLMLPDGSRDSCAGCGIRLLEAAAQHHSMPYLLGCLPAARQPAAA